MVWGTQHTGAQGRENKWTRVLELMIVLVLVFMSLLPTSTQRNPPNTQRSAFPALTLHRDINTSPPNHPSPLTPHCPPNYPTNCPTAELTTAPTATTTPPCHTWQEGMVRGGAVPLKYREARTCECVGQQHQHISTPVHQHASTSIQQNSSAGCKQQRISVMKRLSHLHTHTHSHFPSHTPSASPPPAADPHPRTHPRRTYAPLPSPRCSPAPTEHTATPQTFSPFPLPPLSPHPPPQSPAPARRAPCPQRCPGTGWRARTPQAWTPGWGEGV